MNDEIRKFVDDLSPNDLWLALILCVKEMLKERVVDGKITEEDMEDVFDKLGEVYFKNALKEAEKYRDFLTFKKEFDDFVMGKGE